MPDDLRAQVAPLHEAIKAMGWPLIMEEGVEADDVIGALAKQAEREGIRVIISTGDKDIAQLVNEHVTIVNTMSNEVLDIAGVTNKFGLPPERIVDYLTLIGDTSDNVPGVEKVGPKTAVKWLTQYGTLDNIVSHAGEITGVVGENLRKALPWIPTARELITIRCDVGIQESLSDLAPRAMDKNKLAELFEHFDFKSWRRELDSMGGEPVSVTPLTMPTSSGDLFAPTSETINTAPTETTVDYTPITTRNYATILSEADLELWLEKINQAKLVCFDTETTSLDPMTAKIVGMSFSIEAGSGAYLPLTHDYFDAPVQLNLQQL
jgi:DNA polymerase-1